MKKKKEKEKIKVKPIESTDLGPLEGDKTTFTDVNGKRFEFEVNDEESVLYDIWHVDFKNKEWMDSDGDTFKFEFTTEKDPTTIEEFEKALIKYYDDCYNRTCFLNVAADNFNKPWWNEFVEHAEKDSSFDEFDSYCEKMDISESDAWFAWEFKHGPYKDWEVREKNMNIYAVPKDFES